MFGFLHLAHYSFTIVQVLSAVLYRFVVCTGIVPEGSYMSSLLNNNKGACNMSLGVCDYTSASVYIYKCLCLQVKICTCLIITL